MQARVRDGAPQQSFTMGWTRVIYGARKTPENQKSKLHALAIQITRAPETVICAEFLLCSVVGSTERCAIEGLI